MKTQTQQRLQQRLDEVIESIEHHKSQGVEVPKALIEEKEYLIECLNKINLK
jgi:hypothetical protein